MSLRVMSLVWENFRRGGSEKLALLAMADWCNDQGGSLRPSIRAIAAKIGLSEKQARIVIHRLIDTGYLSVIGNAHGGTPGQTRHYQLHVEKLLTPQAGKAAHPSTTPPGKGPHPSRRSTFTPPAGESQTISEPPVNPEEGKKPGTSPHKGSRLPTDWIPDAIAIADARRLQPGWSSRQIETVGEMFRDYWVAQPGSRGSKTDWRATWRNWVRRERPACNPTTPKTQTRNTEPDPVIEILTGRRKEVEITEQLISGEATHVA